MWRSKRVWRGTSTKDTEVDESEDPQDPTRSFTRIMLRLPACSAPWSGPAQIAEGLVCPPVPPVPPVPPRPEGSRRAPEAPPEGNIWAHDTRK